MEMVGQERKIISEMITVHGSLELYLPSTFSPLSVQFPGQGADWERVLGAAGEKMARHSDFVLFPERHVL